MLHIVYAGPWGTMRYGSKFRANAKFWYWSRLTNFEFASCECGGGIVKLLKPMPCAFAPRLCQFIAGRRIVGVALHKLRVAGIAQARRDHSKINPSAFELASRGINGRDDAKSKHSRQTSPTRHTGERPTSVQGRPSL
jgi:hypothetical protein